MRGGAVMSREGELNLAAARTLQAAPAVWRPVRRAGTGTNA
ncbi:hypothetical protein [Corynebacterium sp.]|nr:hypothetical protein [Corynebacterium sp.]